MNRRILVLPLLLALLTGPADAPPETCVILITTDGLRWQEVFGGAEEALIGDDDDLRSEFWRETPEQRREALLPFLWSVVADEGQIFGDRSAGGSALVTNGLDFSYPGYQEILAGYPDPAIDSNSKTPNPNVTVLEWLEGRPGFEDRVAAFGTWDVLPYIVNRERSGLPVFAAFEPYLDDPPSPFHGSCFDSFTFHATLEYLRTRRPRVLYVMFGETDEWAHAGYYGEYLYAARRVDGFIRRLWDAAQEVYPGGASLVITTDHGRGTGDEWTNHGEDVAGAEEMWIAALGRGVPALGGRSDAVTQAQVAATVAALVGEDYAGAEPRAGEPLPLDPEGRSP